MGFDKIYSLGAIYMTPGMYKNAVLHSRQVLEMLVLLAPVFIHGHSDYDIYYYFCANS